MSYSDFDFGFFASINTEYVMWQIISDECNIKWPLMFSDRLCGLVVRALGYTSGGPGSIPDTTRKKK
jgi:hypothetical protein